MYWPNVTVVTRKEVEKKGRRPNMKERKIPKLPFLDIYIKNPTHPLFGAWSFLLVHVQFTPCEGSKGLKNAFFKKSDHGNVT